jgi:hypothetical protein
MRSAGFDELFLCRSGADRTISGYESLTRQKPPGFGIPEIGFQKEADLS